MDKGNKGYWMSLRKLFAFAVIGLAFATPINAQILTGGSLDMGYSSVVLDPSYTAALREEATEDVSFNRSNLIDNATAFSGNPTFAAVSVPGQVNFTSNVAYGSRGVSDATFFVSYGGGLQITQAGSGTLTLSGNTNYSGGTVLNGGTIIVASPASINVPGTGANVFTGNIGYTGATTVSGGVIILGTSQPNDAGGTIILSSDSLTMSPDPMMCFDLSNIYFDISNLSLVSRIVLSNGGTTQETTTTELPSLQPLTINAVPEPSTIGLLIVAALGAGLTGIRRKAG